jgi:DNA end-binding protein Ku
MSCACRSTKSWRANEVNLAMKLIEGMKADFDPAKYHDTYTEDVKKLIDARAKGEKRQPPATKPVSSNVIDIVAALQEGSVATLEA